jgi:dihydrofolate synthase/folylpolyglutamate synthase
MTLPTTLAGWLAHCDGLHPVGMDLSLERTAEVARRAGIRFTVPVFTVAGTNGKGSTCAMLESVALAAGYAVGCYQKPELVHFEERCRVGGAPVAGEALVPHFAAIEAARAEITLTKFEFTTLAIARLLSQAAVDVVILEVGMGGRFDAVNVFDTDCAVITSIALDHMEWLGPDRESIGFEKAHVMRPGRPAIVSDPLPPQSTIDHASKVGADLWLVGRDFNHSGDRQQWNWAGRGRRIAGMSYPGLRGANQLLNASGVIAAFEAMQDRLPVSTQAIRNGLAMVSLPGRFQIVPGQPTLVLDVAHNPQAVAALAANLDAMGFFPRTHAVFGAMRDKDIAALLPHVVPLVDAWHCCTLPGSRAAPGNELLRQVRECRERLLADGRAIPREATLAAHDGPCEALAAAMAGADPADRIVIFGSFLTVGGVLKAGLPRLGAPHLG